MGGGSVLTFGEGSHPYTSFLLSVVFFIQYLWYPLLQGVDMSAQRMPFHARQGSAILFIHDLWDPASQGRGHKTGFCQLAQASPSTAGVSYLVHT